MVFALGVLFCWFGYRLLAQTNSHGAADLSISGTLKLNDSGALSAGDQVDLARVAHDIRRSLMRPGLDSVIEESDPSGANGTVGCSSTNRRDPKVI